MNCCLLHSCFRGNNMQCLRVILFCSYKYNDDDDVTSININSIMTSEQNDSNFVSTDNNNTTADVKYQDTNNSFLRVRCRENKYVLSKEKLDVLKKIINWSFTILIMYQRYTYSIFNVYI